MDARTRPMDADDMDHAGVQRFDDSQPTAVRGVVAIRGNGGHRDDFPQRRTHPFRRPRRLEGVMMLKIPLPIAWLVGLAVLIVGCSSSQETATPAATIPSSMNAVSTDPHVNAILEQSCYECHSTGGSAPWYAAVSPTPLAANSARGVLNFSDWQTYGVQKRAEALKNIEQSVGAGSMPPGDYTALDHSARLTNDQKQALLKWAS